jgi:branched-chain amino acid transport system ATP-binding protein
MRRSSDDGRPVPGAPALEASSLSVGYGPIPVVHGLDLTVRAGEVVGLLGANGAGKTTTLLALSGELAPSQGEVRIDGVPTTSPLYARARRGLAFVTEERSVFMQLTAGENLRLGRGSAQDALDLMPELGKLLKRRAGLLSGGEQQMLSLARALAARPSVLLADELSLGLAPMIVSRLLAAVRSAADAGAAVLLVEQHVKRALGICDRAYVMHRGRLVIEGTAAELLRRLPEIEDTYLMVSDISSSPEAARTPARTPGRVDR